MSRQSIPAGFPPGGHGPPASPRVAPTTPPSAFLFSVGRALGVVVVTVHGTLDTSGCAQLEQVLEDLIDNQGNLRVVVDLLDLTRVEKGGLAVFRRAATSASTRGGELLLANPRDAVHRALDAAGLAPAVSVTDVPHRCSGGAFHRPESRTLQSGGRSPLTRPGAAGTSPTNETGHDPLRAK